MIHDVDLTIQKLLKVELPPGLVDQVEISFAAPDDKFPQAVTRPAIDLFLYDVRENTDLRDTQWIPERRPDGTLVRRRPPVRVDCSYLITAWPSDNSPSGPLEEHRLLSEVMRALLRHPTIPAALLQESLRGQRPPLPASTLQPGRLQSLAEFWQALGGKPKAALNYTVTVGVTVADPQEAELPVVELPVVEEIALKGRS
jgi:hypothetical protein